MQSFCTHACFFWERWKREMSNLFICLYIFILFSPSSSFRNKREIFYWNIKEELIKQEILMTIMIVMRDEMIKRFVISCGTTADNKKIVWVGKQVFKIKGLSIKILFSSLYILWWCDDVMKVFYAYFYLLFLSKHTTM